jgi:hypothetical protein
MNPAGKVRWNMRKPIELGRDDCNSAELVASVPARDRAAGGAEDGEGMRRLAYLALLGLSH